MIRPVLTLLTCAFPLALASALAGDAPFLATLDHATLLRDSEAFRAGDTSARASHASLLRKADEALTQPALSVMDKHAVPASGDKHDFYAIGKYAWPNPKTPDGMPWFRRDGPENPAAKGDDYDKVRYNLTVERINTLATAWHLTREEKYAAKAADLLRAWFIAPATRMNPNFKYASALPGVHDGMPIGIIEGVVLVRMVDYVNLLALSPSWTPADNDALRAWFRDYTTWLLESDFGKRESAEASNHGVWYAAQVARFSIYTGDRDRAKLAFTLARRAIANQIAPDGGLPREMKRVRSLMYTTYALRAFVTVARCGDYLGEDLWRYQAANGRRLENLFDYLSPFFREEKNWPGHTTPDRKTARSMLSLFRQAAEIYQTPGLTKTVAFLEKLNPASPATTTTANAPVILIRSGWQTVNIGDIAHTPGILTLLQTHIPDARLILWPADIRGEVEPLLRRQFPNVEIVQSDFDADGRPSTSEVRSAFDRANLFLCSSAPDSAVATKAFAAWRTHHAADLKNHPYGFYGVTVDRETAFAKFVGKKPLSPLERDILNEAAFVYTRETASLDYLRREKITTPLLGFAPDAVFGVNQYDTTRAAAWLRANALEKDRYICVIARTRFAPYYKIRKTTPTANDLAREAYNAQHVENDLGKIRDAITRFVQETGLKVVLCPEMTFEVEVEKTEIYDKLPETIRRNVVWKDSYWMPDEAAAVYRDAIALLSMECHSPIIAAAAGVPSLYLTTETETNKSQMWPDLGLVDWMLNLDNPAITGETLAAELIRIQKDPTSARARTARVMQQVRDIQRETMSTIARLATN
ncbi:alginate lyase [Opitutaceae bacterium TAV4]|nr:alginate lyase [Opitutaceae bacterium TAV3]RRK01462.1 alginate lyase [Opitutaceae bacterium TAV4]